ncbi:MAG: T9SS type A sorting domain-containing protein [Bacteroidia bacterium]|nr:T9SS type A sorting domain-containing protein [Bacteroidia bacterium]
MNKYILLFLLIFSNLYSIIINAQQTIVWQKSLGGSVNDVALSIQQTADTGYIVAGYTESNDSDVTVYYGNRDYWIVKLNDLGMVQWQKSFGGTDTDVPYVIQQTSDGGYVVAGYSKSDDIDVTGNHGQEDYWIVKLNSTGVLQWQKSYGGSNVDRAYAIHQTSDGGYVVAGSSNSVDGDITAHHGGISVQNDFWIIRIDSIGALLWEKSLGGGSSDVAYSIQQTTDGGFVIAGSTNSNDGDVTGLHGTPSKADCWIVKLNNNGVILWEKALGGTELDYAYFIQQTGDGGYIMAGNSGSSDGDVSFHWGSFVSNDIWIVKLDSNGFITWEKTFGGTSNEVANFIQQTLDGGYVITGYTNSNDGDLTGLHGLNIDYDYWIIKLNVSGVIQWQQLYGGTGSDISHCIRQVPDGGYIIAGSSSSMNGDVTDNNGSSDFWIVKLSSLINVNEIHSSITNFQTIPNPFSRETIISFQLLSSNRIEVEIHDIEGRLIKNLNSEKAVIGANEIPWDATDNSGGKVNEGVYFVNIISNKFIESRKVVVVKN